MYPTIEYESTLYTLPNIQALLLSLHTPSSRGSITCIDYWMPEGRTAAVAARTSTYSKQQHFLPGFIPDTWYKISGVNTRHFTQLAKLRISCYCISSVELTADVFHLFFLLWYYKTLISGHFTAEVSSKTQIHRQRSSVHVASSYIIQTPYYPNDPLHTTPSTCCGTAAFVIPPPPVHHPCPFDSPPPPRSNLQQQPQHLPHLSCLQINSNSGERPRAPKLSFRRTRELLLPIVLTGPTPPPNTTSPACCSSP